MSLSSDKKNNRSFFEENRSRNTSELMNIQQKIKNYYGDVSDIVITFGSLSNLDSSSRENINQSKLIKDALRRELRSSLKERIKK